MTDGGPADDVDADADADGDPAAAPEADAAADGGETTPDRVAAAAAAEAEYAGSDGTTDSDADDGADGAAPAADADDAAATPGVPQDVQSYERFTKIEGSQYDRVNDFIRDRTYVTAREWAIARLCADFRTDTGVEMTKIGENLPRLVPFMTDTYSPQAVNQARAAFEEKVRKSGATFLYGAMSGFFTPEELDDMLYEVTEVAKFLLEVEGVDLAVEEELDAEDRISAAMREVREASTEVRHGGTACPNCGHEIGADADD